MKIFSNFIYLVLILFAMPSNAQNYMPTQEPPMPSLPSSVIDIQFVGNRVDLYFEEGVEYSYEVIVSLNLPDMEFDTELIDAPTDMTMELKEEDFSFNGAIASTLYVIKWKPSLDAIPDQTIPSIIRFLTLRVNIGSNYIITKDVRYELINN